MSTNAELTKKLDEAVMRITELETENKKLKEGAEKKEDKAFKIAKKLRPGSQVLSAALQKNGVLVAVYNDGKEIYDQDAVASVS